MCACSLAGILSLLMISPTIASPIPTIDQIESRYPALLRCQIPDELQVKRQSSPAEDDCDTDSDQGAKVSIDTLHPDEHCRIDISWQNNPPSYYIRVKGIAPSKVSYLFGPFPQGN